MKKKLIVGVGLLLIMGIAVFVGRKKAHPAFAEGYGGQENTEIGSSEEIGGAASLSYASRNDDRGGAVAPDDGYAEENLSDAVKALVGLDGGEHDYNSLEAAIHELSKALSADDVAALREMLTWPNDRFPEGMRAIEINAVKNDVLDRLLRQNELPEGIGLQMVEMASNPENDPVWRDYCIQFCPTVWERIDAEYRIMNNEQGISKDAEHYSAQNDPACQNELEAVREAMVSALDERDSTIAGTSLIGLELLSRTHDEFDRESILSSAVEIAADESASPSPRLTALRLSALVNSKLETGNSELGSDAVVETARMLAQTGETVLLRSAAIVTLGETGSEEDRELLESFALSDNKQIIAAAELALQKMGEKN